MDTDAKPVVVVKPSHLRRKKSLLPVPDWSSTTDGKWFVL